MISDHDVSLHHAAQLPLQEVLLQAQPCTALQVEYALHSMQ